MFARILPVYVPAEGEKETGGLLSAEMKARVWCCQSCHLHVPLLAE